MAAGTPEELEELLDARSAYMLLGKELLQEKLSRGQRKLIREKRQELFHSFGAAVRQRPERSEVPSRNRRIDRDIRKELRQPDLSEERRELLEGQRRQLEEDLRPASPISRYVTIRKPPELGALLLLFGQDKVPNVTSYFIPSRLLLQEGADAVRRGPRGVVLKGPPGSFNPPLDQKRLALELVLLAEKLYGAPVETIVRPVREKEIEARRASRRGPA